MARTAHGPRDPNAFKHTQTHLDNKQSQVILTLKDDAVLERDEHGNVLGLSRTAEEGGLELENALLSEKAKDQERQQRAKRARLPAYSGQCVLPYICFCCI